ncbi:MAG: T9SS type A sorting domain-containing protein [Cytophagaceae bacterium]
MFYQTYTTLYIDHIRFHYEGEEEDDDNDNGGDTNDDPLALNLSKDNGFTVNVSDRIIYTSSDISDYTLLNMNGNPVASGNTSTSMIPVSNFIPGIYILRGIVNGNVVTQRIAVF